MEPSSDRIPGTAVPEVDPADVKVLWELYREVEASHPGQQVGIGSGLVAQRCSKGADIQALGYRTSFLRLMAAHAEEISPWIKDGQPDAALFHATAHTRMEWMQSGVERQGPPFSMEEFMRRVTEFEK